VPLKLTLCVLPLEELLAIASVPDAAPVLLGSNWTVRVLVCPGNSTTGKPGLASEKPEPEIEAPLTVTAAVPAETRVTVCVVAVFTD